MTTGDERQAAAARIEELVALLRRQQGPDTAKMIDECEALSRDINAFHMEGIRFRIYNVDRQLAQHAASLPGEARTLLEEARRHLEASGFHTRSHQSPV
jgi:hypothetical protein